MVALVPDGGAGAIIAQGARNLPGQPLVATARVTSRKASTVVVRVKASRAGRYQLRLLSRKRIVARKTVTLKAGVSRSLRVTVPRRFSSVRAKLSPEVDT